MDTAFSAHSYTKISYMELQYMMLGLHLSLTPKLATSLSLQ
jgi:hypothetical protein